MTEVNQVLQQLLEGQKRLQEEVEQLKGKARAEASTGDMDEDTAEAERGEQMMGSLARRTAKLGCGVKGQPNHPINP